MVDKALFMKYTKIALIGWAVTMCGFGVIQYLAFGVLGRLMMLGGILLGWWGVGKAMVVFFRGHFSKSNP